MNSLGQSFKNMGLYVSSAMIVRELWRALREGTQYIKELDEAFTDISISMNITREEFNKWTQDARKIAQANGVLTTSIMDMVKIYATAGEDISEVQDKLAGTAMIQNITQWEADETTSAVNSIINQYKLLDKEINGTTGNVANAINYLGDNLIGISNALSIDNVKGIQEMVSAIDDAGSVISNAGGSMEWYMGVTGALAEATNSTGSEIGATMRMVTARTLRQGEAISELEAQGEDMEIAMAKAEKALTDIGVTIRGETADELRNIEDIVGDVAGAWDTLSDSQRQAVSEAMAGTQRSSMFSALIENYEKVLELQDKGLNSNGDLAEANRKRVESLEGQINILTDKMLAFMDGLQPIVHGSVQLGNAILDIVNKIGSVPVALGLVTSAFVGFTKEGRMVRDCVIDVTKNLISMAMRTKLTATETKVATVATKGFKLEVGLLQSAMTFGLSLAIGAVVSGLSYLIDRMKNSSKYAKEMADDVTSALGDINTKIENTSSADKMIAQYKELGDELSLISVDTEEYREKVEELKTIKGQLLELFPTAIAGYDSEGNAILKDAENLEKLNAQQREQLEIQQTILKNEAISNMGSVEKDLENEIKLRDEALAKAKMWEDYINNTDLTEKQKPAYNNLMSEANKEAKKHNDTVISLTATMNGYKNALGIVTDETDNLSNSTNEAKESLDGMEDNIDTVSDKLSQMHSLLDDDKSVNENFVSLGQQLVETKKILSEINEDGLNFDNMEDTLSLFGDFVGDITNATQVQEYLNNKILEMSEAQGIAYSQMLSQSGNYWDSEIAKDEDLWNNKIKNSEAWLEHEKVVVNQLEKLSSDGLLAQEGDFINYVNSLGEYRNLDLSNAKNMAEAQGKLEAVLVGDLKSFWASLINKKGENRTIDMQNILAFLNTQGAKEAQTVEQLRELWSKYYQAKAKSIKDELYSLEERLGTVYEGDKENLYSDMMALNKLNSNMNNYFNSLDTTFKGVSGGLAQTSAGVDKLNNSLSNSSSGSSDKASSDKSSSDKSSSSEKVIENMKNQISVYYALEQAIKKMTNALETNSKAQQMVATKSELKKLLEEELYLMKEKQFALEKNKEALLQEQETLKHTLESGYGFEFDGNNLVGGGYETMLKRMSTLHERAYWLSEWANKKSGLDKEYAIAEVENIYAMIERYSEIMNTELPDIDNGFGDLAYEIRQAKKEHEELLKAVENLSDRYLKFTMQTTFLDNELSLNRKKQEYAIGTELLSLRSRELEILKQQKNVNTEKVNELKKEREELNKILSSDGLYFDSNGLIINYDEFWKNATSKYNEMAGLDAEDYKEELDELEQNIERYLDIVNGELPEAEKYYYDIADSIKEIEEQHKAWAEQLEQVSDLLDRLYDTTNKLTKVTNELSLIDAKLTNASGDSKIALLKRQVELYEAQKKLLNEQLSIQKQQATEIQVGLSGSGVEFGTDGYVSNYESLVKKMQSQIESMPGGEARDEAIEELEELMGKIQEYTDLVSNEIPSTEQEWWELNNSIKDAQKEQLEIVESVQQSISDAIKNKWQENTQAVQDEINKQKDILNKQWSNEDWEDELGKAETELNKLQAQINNMSKDTTLAGQLKLEQLKEQYREQLDSINEMIKDHEREQSNQMLEDEIDRINDEMENALTPENLANLVNDALSSGIVKIGEEQITLNDLMLDSIYQQEDAYYALGKVMKSEMISSLEEARNLWKDINSLTSGLGSNNVGIYGFESALKTLSDIIPQASKSILENNSAPLISVVFDGGNQDGITMSDVNNVVQKACDGLVVKLNKLMG